MVNSTTHNNKPDIARFRSRSWLTLVAYFFVGIAITTAWQLSDRQLVVASEGAGYFLGITGTTMMVLLLLYPLRKRARFLQRAGPIKLWFRVHMMLGIVGPVLVLFHSNFNLGSLNSQVALFSMLIVSFSGILGRYLYGKVHYGLYGQRATLESLQSEVDGFHDSAQSLNSLLPTINQHLAPIESSIITESNGLFQSVVRAVRATFSLFFVRLVLRRRINRKIAEIAKASDVVKENKKRLAKSTARYLTYRLSVLRKFAQLQACEKLFSLWHVVHYPLFIVLVVAATVHVVAVHMY